MLNLFEKQKVFYDEFIHYFDRTKNLNVFFSFNFISLLKEIHQDVDEEILKTFKDDYQIKVYLTKKEEYHNFIQEFDSIEKINLYNSVNFSTFYCKKNIKNLYGEYQILVKIFYNSKTREYINFRLGQENVSTSEINYLSKIKIINEQKDVLYEKKSFNLLEEYHFLSPEFSINSQTFFISNLYQIYNSRIKKDLLSSFLNSLENLRKINIDTTICANYYIDNNNPKKLNIDQIPEDIENYNQLINNIFRNNLNFNIFDKQRTSTTKTARKSIVSNDTINSLQSNSCDFDIKNFNLPKEKRQITNMVRLSSVIDNIPEILNDNFCSENIEQISAYVIDKFVNYKIYYLRTIKEKSMTQVWEQLTKDKIQNLDTNIYLCKICADKDFLSNSLIENYFILEN